MNGQGEKQRSNQLNPNHHITIKQVTQKRKQIKPVSKHTHTHTQLLPFFLLCDL
jgi:hypothetical protein